MGFTLFIKVRQNFFCHWQPFFRYLKILAEASLAVSIYNKKVLLSTQKR